MSPPAIVIAAAATAIAVTVAAGCAAQTSVPAVSAPAASSSVSPSPRSSAVAPTRLATATPRVRAHSAEPPPIRREPAPIGIKIVDIGLALPIDAVGIAASGRFPGQLDLPKDPARLGWFKYGSSPSSRAGSVVLGGHLDTRADGIGPLVKLRDSKSGDRILVTLVGGGSVAYRVKSVVRIAKRAVDTDRLFNRDGPRLLYLITCGGRYLRERGGYQDNLVVMAVPED